MSEKDVYIYIYRSLSFSLYINGIRASESERDGDREEETKRESERERERETERERESDRERKVQPHLSAQCMSALITLCLFPETSCIRMSTQIKPQWDKSLASVAADDS